MKINSLQDNTEISSLKAEIENLKTTVNGLVGKTLKAAYPVGAIYMCVHGGNPKDYFGFGTWEQIKDKFLLSVGDTYKTVNSTGGSSSHTHSLGDEGGACMQFDMSGSNLGFFEHRHGPSTSWKANSRYLVSLYNTSHEALNNENQTHSLALMGATKSTTNLPPYITVYVWKRTA